MDHQPIAILKSLADKACVRYTASQGDFSLEVSEWHYRKDHLIGKIVACYPMGEIREDRRLNT